MADIQSLLDTLREPIDQSMMQEPGPDQGPALMQKWLAENRGAALAPAVEPASPLRGSPQPIAAPVEAPSEVQTSVKTVPLVKPPAELLSWANELNQSIASTKSENDQITSGMNNQIQQGMQAVQNQPGELPGSGMEELIQRQKGTQDLIGAIRKKYFVPDSTGQLTLRSYNDIANDAMKEKYKGAGGTAKRVLIDFMLGLGKSPESLSGMARSRAKEDADFSLKLLQQLTTSTGQEYNAAKSYNQLSVNLKNAKLRETVNMIGKALGSEGKQVLANISETEIERDAGKAVGDLALVNQSQQKLLNASNEMQKNDLVKGIFGSAGPMNNVAQVAKARFYTWLAKQKGGDEMAKYPDDPAAWAEIARIQGDPQFLEKAIVKNGELLKETLWANDEFKAELRRKASQGKSAVVRTVLADSAMWPRVQMPDGSIKRASIRYQFQNDGTFHIVAGHPITGDALPGVPQNIDGKANAKSVEAEEAGLFRAAGIFNGLYNSPNESGAGILDDPGFGYVGGSPKLLNMIMGTNIGGVQDKLKSADPAVRKQAWGQIKNAQAVTYNFIQTLVDKFGKRVNAQEADMMRRAIANTQDTREVAMLMTGFEYYAHMMEMNRLDPVYSADGSPVWKREARDDFSKTIFTAVSMAMGYVNKAGQRVNGNGRLLNEQELMKLHEIIKQNAAKSTDTGPNPDSWNKIKAGGEKK